MDGPDANLLGRFVRRSASFGSVLFTVKVLNFLLLLFVFWRLLDPEQFGVIAVAQGVTTVLAPGLNFGLSNSVSRLFKQYESRGQGRDLIGSVFVTAALGAAAVCAVVYFAAGPLVQALFPTVPFAPYMQLAVVSAFFLSMCLFGEQVLRVTDRLRLNGALVAAELALKNAAMLAAVLLLADGAFAFLLGEMLALGLVSAIYSVATVRGARIRLSPAFLRESAVLALPVVPAGMLDQLNNYLDQFVLANYVPRAQLGLYSQAVKVGTVLDILTRALKTVWFPTLLRSRDGGPENRKLITQSYVFTFDFLAFVVLGIAFIAPIVIRLLAPAKFHPMCVYLPVVGAVLLVKNYVFLPSLRLLTTRFALATLLSSAATTATAAALHLTLTVRFGIVGALISLCGTYLLSFAVAEGLARRVTPADIPWGRLAARILVFSAVVAAATWILTLPPGPGVHLLGAAAFLLVGTPVAVFYYRNRRLLSGEGKKIDPPPGAAEGTS